MRPDRSFYLLPSFNEETLPRVLTINNYVTNVESWYPFAASTSGLGFDFALVRGGQPLAFGRSSAWGLGPGDLAAVRHLNEVRTADLTQSREFLSSAARSHGMSMYASPGG